MKQYKPMLARSAETPFSYDDWIFEVKWDGIRAISYLEGELSMAKKKQSFYESGKRSNNWLKIKQVKTCDCVVFGYTRGEGNRDETFGSLILGLYDVERPV